jgi:dTDP-4-dehydrorhamnose reductase
MVTNRILLFGGHEQVGNALQRLALPADWHIKFVGPDECDFTQGRTIGKAVQDFAPDLVINATAMNDLEACEKNGDMAQEINFHAVANIAAQCDTVAAPFIHLSTADVFDGKDSAPYVPDDPMNPINVYGQTRMMGEEAVRHGLYWHVIVRTSLVFSAIGDNVLTQTLRQIDTQDEVLAATDQIISPTSATAVAEALTTIAAAILHGKGNGFGTFHIGSELAVTRFEFLQAMMEAYAPFTTRRPKLTPVSAASLTDRVLEPLSTALNGDKLREIYGTKPHDWREDLAQAVKEYAEKQKTES